jgi:type II secretory pathway component PulJ
MFGAERRPSGRGVTLLEVLVVSVLSLMALGVLFSVLVPTAKSSRKVSKRVELQQLGTLTLSRMARDLDKSVPEGIQTTGERLSIHPLTGLTANGFQVFADHSLLYVWNEDTRTLDFTRWEPGALSIDRAFAPAISELATLTESSLNPICRHVNGFSALLVDHEGEPVSKDGTVESLVGNSFRLVIELESGKESMVLSRQVTLHNTSLGR